jgi:hypothetical protein
MTIANTIVANSSKGGNTIRFGRSCPVVAMILFSDVDGARVSAD